MSTTISTLSYWMLILRNIKEFQEIAKTEDVELNLLRVEVEKILNNFYIDTADITGITRLEKIMGIKPDAGATLETRRLKLFNRWANSYPYTPLYLKEKIDNMAKALLIEDPAHYTLVCKFNNTDTLPSDEIVSEIDDLIEDVKPANIIYYHSFVCDWWGNVDGTLTWGNATTWGDLREY